MVSTQTSSAEPSPFTIWPYVDSPDLYGLMSYFFFWIFLPALLYRMVIVAFSFRLQTDLLFRAPSSTGWALLSKFVPASHDITLGEPSYMALRR